MSGANGASIEIGQSDQELVGFKKKRPYKKYLRISLIVIGIIVVVVVYVNKGSDPSDETTTTTSTPTDPPVAAAITLEDILNNKLYARRNNATWISATELQYRNSNDLVKYNVQTKTITPVLGTNESILAHAFRYTLSPDQKLCIYRRSTESTVDVVDLTTHEIHHVDVTVTNGTYISRLLSAEWAPTGNGIVFVASDRNIYYKPNVLSDPIAVTTDGSPVIFNGVCDWVYEEEVFSSDNALWFSPDGTKLAYVQFNDTEVQLMHLKIYGPPGSIQFQYVHLVPMHYPKVNTKNPTVKLFSVNLSSLTPGQQLTENVAPAVIRDVDHIITSVAK